MATLSSSTGRAAGWRGGPALGSAQPRARALQRFRPNRSPDDVAVDRWDRARAHARGRPAPRAATSGALVLVRFRVAALLAGRPWGLVTRAGVHERSRRRGSARCPESGRCAGGGRRCQEAPLSPGGLGLPQSGPDGVAQDPRRGAVPGCWKGGGGGRGAARPGSLELRVSGPPPPRHQRPWTSHSSFLGLSFLAVRWERRWVPLSSLTVQTRAVLEGAWVEWDPDWRGRYLPIPGR